jgi:hypothetical protein
MHLTMDENLQSCLAREERWINKKKMENKLDIDPRYEYARAEKNYKEIKRIKDSNGASLIQAAIQTLTKLGNCLAFIRLLRTSS